MSIFLCLFIILCCNNCYADKDYQHALTSLTVMQFNIHKFNESDVHVCESYRSSSQTDNRNKALSFLRKNYVKKGYTPFSMEIHITLSKGVEFEYQVEEVKQYCFEIMLEDLVRRLQYEVSPEIIREHLTGKISWSSFSNAAKKNYYREAIIENGKITKIKKWERDYFLPDQKCAEYTTRGYVDENGKTIKDFSTK